MTLLRRLFQLYIRGSIHVALSVVAMVRITQILFEIPFNLPIIIFAFTSAVAAYNFVKFHGLIRRGASVSNETRLIAVMSFCLIPIGGLCFFHLQITTQAMLCVLGILTVAYAIPFLGKRTVRSLAGAKIHIVALCWTGITVALPAIEGGAPIDLEFYILMLQRFILIIVLLLIFDIVDLRRDSPSLGTVPQRLGIAKTKILGYVLLILFVGLDAFRTENSFARVFTLLLTAIATAIFLYYSSDRKPKFYTAFWVESIPIFWLFVLMLLT